MRIVFVLKRADFSGGVRVVAQYARLLGERGHEVLVISTPAGLPTAVDRAKALIRGKGWLPDPGLPRSHLDSTGVEHRILDRVRPVKDRDVPNADVIIATWWETVEWVSALRDKCGAKLHLVQDHEVWGGPRHRVDSAYRAPIPKIVISRFLRDILIREYGIEPVATIPNGVDTTLFDAPPRHKQLAPTVGLTYATKRNKGTDIACAAFQIAAQRISRLRMIAMGNEPVLPELPLPYGSEFILSARGDLPCQLYSRCDAWLFPSRWEGFGLPILEAMACRTPVIGTPAGAAPEILERGGGLLVPADDPAAMAQAIERVHAMAPAAWAALSDTARSTALSFSWAAAVSSLERVLKMVSRRA